MPGQLAADDVVRSRFLDHLHIERHARHLAGQPPHHLLQTLLNVTATNLPVRLGCDRLTLAAFVDVSRQVVMIAFSGWQRGRFESPDREAVLIGNDKRSSAGRITHLVTSLEISGCCAAQRFSSVWQQVSASHSKHDLRAVSESMAGAAEHGAVDDVARHKTRLNIEPCRLHVRHHFHGIGIRAGRVVDTVDDDHFRGRSELLHHAQVSGIPDKPQFLLVDTQIIRAVRVTAPARVQSAATGQIERDVVAELFHSAHVDDAGERARSELVGHQRDVAASGTASAEQPPVVELVPALLQAIAHKPQRPQRIKRLQIAEVVRFGIVDRCLPAALQIVHTDGDDVQPLSQHIGTGCPRAILAAPVVQSQHHTGPGIHASQRAAGVRNSDPYDSRPPMLRPLLSWNLDSRVALWQRWPVSCRESVNDQ